MLIIILYIHECDLSTQFYHVRDKIRDMKVNDKLKALRVESGLTQKELADKLNIGQTTVTSYENSTRTPQMESLIAYADYFKCSLDFLVERESQTDDLTITAITTEEKELLKTYRSLTGDLKEHLYKYAKLLNLTLNK